MTAPKVTWSKDKADAALAPYREILAYSPDFSFHAMLLLHVERILGMCPRDKINALHNAFQDKMPCGDVVEIGTWWGKSALVLLLLARRYGIGNVLCVDPWTDEALVQGVPAVDEASAALSAEEAFEVFKMNLLPYAHEGINEWSDEPRSDSAINYSRMTSKNGHGFYTLGRARYSITTEAFGVTHYACHIALLHIDGNHAYEKVKQDVELWAPLVVPGGWVVVDDYDWRHGDGPRRAADELICRLTTELGKPAPRHFVAGGAMFIQMEAP